MEEIVLIKDKEVREICEDCIMSENCKNKDTYKQARCCFNFRFIPANIQIEKQPENIEDVKVLLDEGKIKYTTYYTNEKDFAWKVGDKEKILRAINIEFKTKFCGEFSAYGCCIGNKNDITIRKYKYQGQEFVTMQFSTMEQVWDIFKNIYKDVNKEQ